MREKIQEIISDLLRKNINKKDAINELLILHDVKLSLPTDSEIEVLADESYKEAIKDFPIHEEYEYTQGYIQGAIVMRNKIEL